MTQKKRPGPKPHVAPQTYISVRIPTSIALALHTIADTKKTSRNKLINDVLRAVVNEVTQ
jgi:predicted HicB family RNase H-like nuclease